MTERESDPEGGRRSESQLRVPTVSAIEQTLDRLGPVVPVLVSDGAIEWAPRDPSDVFAMPAAASGTYDERLAAALTDDADTLARLQALRREGGLEAFDVSAGTDARQQVALRSVPLPDQMGADRLDVLTDVTGAVERQADLRTVENLVENAIDGIFTLDAEGVIDFANPAMADLLGYEREALLGKHASEIIAEDEIEPGEDAVAALEASSDAGSPVREVACVTKAGERRTYGLHVTDRPADDGADGGLIGVMRDVTDRKERDRELERYETVIQALGDPVYVLDAEGRFTAVNEAFERVTGYDAEEVIGKTPEIVMAREDVREGTQIVRSLLGSDQPNDTFQITLQTRDGEAIPMDCQLSLLPFEDEYRGQAGVLRDVSDRERREQRLEQFTSIVAHDLRNPLAIMEANLELYRETGDDERLDALQNAIDRMGGLIGDLLELAQAGELTGDLGPVSLAPLSREVWGRVQTESAALAIETDARIRADRARLGQLLENLFCNAVEHGQDGITVTVGDAPEGFYVADDGPGIPPDEHEQVFEHGYSLAEDGSGFGLSIVREIAEAHDWSIQIDESEAGGARFTVSGVEPAE